MLPAHAARTLGFEQRPIKLYSEFMDHVKLAIDMLNFDVTPEEKLQEAYQGNYEPFWSRASGQHQKRVVWGVPTPPNSIDGALAGANAVEAEDDKRRNERPVAAVTNIPA